MSSPLQGPTDGARNALTVITLTELSSPQDFTRYVNSVARVR